jgi:hypothetical protein
MDLNGWFFHILAVKLLKHDSCGQVSIFTKRLSAWFHYNVIIRRGFRIVYVLYALRYFSTMKLFHDS